MAPHKDAKMLSFRSEKNSHKGWNMKNLFIVIANEFSTYLIELKPKNDTER